MSSVTKLELEKAVETIAKSIHVTLSCTDTRLAGKQYASLYILFK